MTHKACGYSNQKSINTITERNNGVDFLSNKKSKDTKKTDAEREKMRGTNIRKHVCSFPLMVNWTVEELKENVNAWQVSLTY